VALLRICRDRKLNALSSHIESEIKKALATDEVTTSRVVVITGSDRAFSAGADLSELPNPTPEQVMDYYHRTGDMHERFAALPQPTIAAISGWCLGGGFELALAADIRVAHVDAGFGLPEVEIGIVPSSGGLLRLVRAVGTARAKELVLLRTRFSAAEALQMGCITEVCEGDVVARALELAEQLAQLPPLAASIAKQACDAIADSSRDGALLIERLAYAALAKTEESAKTSERWSS
jgi:enoyl-CoA hydratase/carnithine racemase